MNQVEVSDLLVVIHNHGKEERFSADDLKAFRA